MRGEIKKRWLDDPNCFSYAHLDPEHAEKDEWFDIVAWFVEVVSDHLLFLRAVQVETQDNFKQFFSTRIMMLRTSYEDRVQLFLMRDMHSKSTLRDLWY